MWVHCEVQKWASWTAHHLWSHFPPTTRERYASIHLDLTMTLLPSQPLNCLLARRGSHHLREVVYSDVVALQAGEGMRPKIHGSLWIGYKILPPPPPPPPPPPQPTPSPSHMGSYSPRTTTTTVPDAHEVIPDGDDREGQEPQQQLSQTSTRWYLTGTILARGEETEERQQQQLSPTRTRWYLTGTTAHSVTEERRQQQLSWSLSSRRSHLTGTA